MTCFRARQLRLWPNLNSHPGKTIECFQRVRVSVRPTALFSTRKETSRTRRLQTEHRSTSIVSTTGSLANAGISSKLKPRSPQRSGHSRRSGHNPPSRRRFLHRRKPSRTVAHSQRFSGRRSDVDGAANSSVERRGGVDERKERTQVEMETIASFGVDATRGEESQDERRRRRRTRRKDADDRHSSSDGTTNRFARELGHRRRTKLSRRREGTISGEASRIGRFGGENERN